MSIFTSTLEALITYLHFSFQNWGWTIFALAILIRLILFPIQMFNFKQQKLMAKIQPELNRLQTLHKEDPLKLYKTTSEIKTKEGVKTGWSLLTSLLQIPIFISIYRVFSSMQTLMGGSFAWVTSLGAPDPLFIFPAAVALSSYLVQRGSASAQLEANASMSSVMKFMPLVSLAFMVEMPAGLVAYYAASGFLQLAGDFVLRRMSA